MGCCFFLSLGKLEEEFEKKFNSLPQFSPMTFDKKSTAVVKKKKPESPAPAQEEGPKAAKGRPPNVPQTLALCVLLVLKGNCLHFNHAPTMHFCVVVFSFCVKFFARNSALQKPFVQ